MRKALLLIAAVAGVLSGQEPGVSVPAGTWTQLTPSGAPGYSCNAAWEKAHYAPVLDMLVVLCSYRAIGTETNRSWLGYSFKENKIYVLDNNSTWHNEHSAEGGHPVGGAAIDPTHSVMYGWGNFSGAQASERVQGTYAYDFLGRTGRFLQPPSHPNYNAQQPTGAYDPLHSKLVTFGGADAGVGTNEYTPSTNTWATGVSCTLVAANCPKPGLQNAGMALNTFDGKFYLFGGLYSGITHNELFVYDPVAQTWAALTPTGGPPAARQAMGWVYLEADNKFLLYGGSANANATTGIITDTWLYDPVANTWTQLSPAASPTGTTGAVYERMVYVPGDDVVILINLDSNTSFWAFRLNPGGKAGRIAAPAYSVTPGSSNRNVNSWAESPSLAASGTSLYGAWVETGQDTDVSVARYFWPYVTQWTGGVGSNLGAAYNSISNEFSSLESDDISIAVVGTQPWVSWHQQNNSNFLDRLYSKTWNGSTWAGGTPGQLTSGASSYTQGPSQVTDIGGAPYIVLKERAVQTVTPTRVFAYVVSQVGSVFSPVGLALNRNSVTDATNISIVDSVSITNNGANQPCVAHTEYTVSLASNSVNDSAPQVYAECWNGTAWVAQGASANVIGTDRAYDVSTIFFGGQQHIAFVSRTATGPAKVWVRKWTGSAWFTVGTGSLTRDPTNGWAFRPRLATDGTFLYLAWEEQGNQTTWAFVQPSYGHASQIYVDKWDGTVWTKVGGSLNADTNLGSAIHPDIAVLGGNPSVISAEVKFGTLRQAYVRSWGGLDWNGFSSTLRITSTSPLPNGDVGVQYQGIGGYQLQASAGAPTYIWSLLSGTLPTGLAVSAAGVISGTPSGTGTFNFTIKVTDNLAATDQVAFSLTVNAGGSGNKSSSLSGRAKLSGKTRAK